MFRLLCFEYRIVSVEYFLDELREWEAKELLYNLDFVDVNERQLLRGILYVLVQQNNKKKLDISSTWPLPWDKMKKEETATEKELENLRDEAKDMEDMLNSGKIKLFKEKGNEMSFKDLLKTNIPT